MSRGEREPVDQARAVLDRLIVQRRELRLEGADTGTLEANRLGIAYWHLRLAQARAGQDRSDAAA